MSLAQGSRETGADRARHWTLDPAVTFLNHGSFGACPKPVLAYQQRIRDEMGSLCRGGWTELREVNNRLVRTAREMLCRRLEIPPPAPEGMLGSLASIPLPPGDAVVLETALFERYRIVVPVVPWPAPPGRLVRISAQLYNDLEQYERLGSALQELR